MAGRRWVPVAAGLALAILAVTPFVWASDLSRRRFEAIRMANDTRNSVDDGRIATGRVSLILNDLGRCPVEAVAVGIG